MVRYSVDENIGNLGEKYRYKKQLFIFFFALIPMIVEIMMYFYFFRNSMPNFFSISILLIIVVGQPFLSLKYYKFISRCDIVVNNFGLNIDFVNDSKKNIFISNKSISQFFVVKGDRNYKLYILVNSDIFRDYRKNLRIIHIVSTHYYESAKFLQNEFEKILGLEHKEIDREYKPIIIDKQEIVDICSDSSDSLDSINAEIVIERHSKKIDSFITNTVSYGEFEKNKPIDKQEIVFPYQYSFFYTDSGFKLVGKNIPAGDLIYKDRIKLLYLIFAVIIYFATLFFIVFNFEKFIGKSKVAYFIFLIFFVFVLPYILNFISNKINYRKVREVNVNENGIDLFFVDDINNSNISHVSASDISSVIVKEIPDPKKYVAPIVRGKRYTYDPHDIRPNGVYIKLKNDIVINRRKLKGTIFTGVSFDYVITGKFLKYQFKKVLGI